MRSGIALLLVTVLCFCSGCAKYYYREGTSIEQAQKDLVECASELEKRVTNDKPGDYEHKFTEDCMRQKAYDLVSEDKLPLTATREDPDMSLRGFLYGRRPDLAGTVERVWSDCRDASLPSIGEARFSGASGLREMVRCLRSVPD